MFNVEVINANRRNIRRRIYRAWRLGCEYGYDIDWYGNARKDIEVIARKHNVSVTKVADMVAVLSANIRWDRNLIVTDNIISAIKESPSLYSVDNPPPGDGYPDNRVKAYQLYNDIPIKFGPKTYAFACNLKGDLTPCTIDMWMVRLFMGWSGKPSKSSDEVPTEVGYRLMDTIMRDIAAKLDVTTAMLQSTLWQVQRNIYAKRGKK